MPIKKTYDFKFIKLKEKRKLNDFEVIIKKKYIEVVNNFTTLIKKIKSHNKYYDF